MDLKPWISVGVSVTLAFHLELDLFADTLGKDGEVLSKVLTGLFIAGGSTGIYKFFKRARKLKDAAVAK